MRDSLAGLAASVPAAWHAHYFDAVDSTQAEARAAARAGAPHRSMFVADYQRSGRGRQGRTWLAPPGTGLLMSLLFRELTSSSVPWRWTTLASVALVEAIEQHVQNCDVRIKWPNDVMLGDRKVAGVLAETTSNSDEMVAIVGVGLNVNTAATELADLPNATSLLLASGKQVSRLALLLQFVQRLDAGLARDPDELFEMWRNRLWGRGQHLRLADLGLERDVVIVDAERDGALVVMTADGQRLRTSSGELLP